MGRYTSAAVLVVRLFGFFWVLGGLWMLAANVVESLAEFDPSFVGYYLQSQGLRPGLAILFGLLLLWQARRLGRWVAQGLDS